MRVHHAVLDWLHAAQLHDKMEDSVLFPWLETKKEGITKEFSKEVRDRSILCIYNEYHMHMLVAASEAGR